MFTKIGNGWELMKSSVQVLRLDASLLLFPFLSAIACLFVVGSFALPLFFTGALTIENVQPQQFTHNPLAYVVLFAFYFCNYFVIIFFNSALIACAVIRFNGGTPTVSDGFQAAVSRLPQILAWCLVTATVGFVLKLIESQSEKIGQIISGLLGLAWSIATFFVVPAIVVEGSSPIEAIKRSGAILRRTWGEAFVANQSVGLVIFLLMLLALIPAGLGFLIGGMAAIVGGIVASVILIVGLSIVSTALHTILLGALYVYAAEGRVPYAFDGAVLSSAFAKKRS
ncbi:MAG TPA: DUF6159 family protein [Planctomycetaceae bacterium]|nr:DUF6159 family protein [Planctomycetaceae bacterium]